MATRTKITDTFPITAGNGDIYRIVEVTEFAIMSTATGEIELPGKVWYKTEDGRGVNKHGDGTYSIPTLGVVGVDNRSAS